MKFFTNIMLVCGLLVCGPITQAQDWPKLPINVTGQLVGGARPKDSIAVMLYTDYILFGSKTFKIPLDQSGKFKINFPDTDKPITLKLSLSGSIYLFLNRMLEPGDNLQLRVDLSDKLPVTSYSGNNIAKYRCMDTLQKELEVFWKKRPALLAPLTQFRNIESDYRNIHSLYATAYQHMLERLGTFAPLLSPQAIAYTRATYANAYLSSWEFAIIAAFNNVKLDSDKELLIKIHEAYKYPDYDLNKNIAAYNENYLLHLLQKEKTASFIQSFGKGYSYKQIYENLKSTYSGILGERLVVYFLVDHKSFMGVINFEPKEFDDCLSDAIQWIKDPNLKQVITDKMLLKKGTSVYSFRMPDTIGKIISLEDFKGKVVLLDVWAEGCGGCAQFAHLFKTQIFPKLKYEPNFSMVSIGVNKTKEGWIRGINSGRYTQKYHTNLFTLGQGLNHPFIQYYKVNTIPFIMLINKNGKVFSKIDLSMTASEILRLIDAALKESQIDDGSS